MSRRDFGFILSASIEILFPKTAEPDIYEISLYAQAFFIADALLA